MNDRSNPLGGGSGSGNPLTGGGDNIYFNRADNKGSAKLALEKDPSKSFNNPLENTDPAAGGSIHDRKSGLLQADRSGDLSEMRASSASGGGRNVFGRKKGGSAGRTSRAALHKPKKILSRRRGGGRTL